MSAPKGTDVKKMEEKLEEFEEIEETPQQGMGSGQQKPEGGFEKERPEYSVLQPDRDKDGNSILVSVGGMWKKTSKNGNDFYVLKIGRLKLLVFKNEKDRQGGFNER